MTHTEHGKAILRNFLFDIAGVSGSWNLGDFRKQKVDEIRALVGDRKVIAGVSGGVDSSVAALLVAEAIGEQLTAIFVDNGVLRKNEAIETVSKLSEGLGLHIVAVDARQRFWHELAGIEDPELKRRKIGHEFIAVFEEEARRIEGVEFLVQGTLYPDVIESVSVKGPSAVIKTHHNVGGLPEKMGLKLIEPLRELFKDEVRRLGIELGLDEQFVWRHPFPGPGLAVRILGEVTPERVEILQNADAIFIEEIRAAGLYREIAQAFVVLLPIRSVGVMGDERTYENVCAIRVGDDDRLHDRRLVPLPVRRPRPHLPPHRERSPRHQPRRLRRLEQAPQHDRVGVEPGPPFPPQGRAAPSRPCHPERSEGSGWACCE